MSRTQRSVERSGTVIADPAPVVFWILEKPGSRVGSAPLRAALRPGHEIAYSCFKSASPPETSTLPGASSMLSFFTVPSSTSME